MRNADSSDVSRDAKAKATGFYKKMTEKSVVLFGHFLWDIVICLSKLSLVLQQRKTSILEVQEHLIGTVAIIKKYKEK